MAHCDMGEVEPTGKNQDSTSWEEEVIPQERDHPAGTAKASELQAFGGHHCSHESHWILGVPREAWLFSVETFIHLGVLFPTSA